MSFFRPLTLENKPYNRSRISSKEEKKLDTTMALQEITAALNIFLMMLKNLHKISFLYPNGLGISP